MDARPRRNSFCAGNPLSIVPAKYVCPARRRENDQQSTRHTRLSEAHFLSFQCRSLKLTIRREASATTPIDSIKAADGSGTNSSRITAAALTETPVALLMSLLTSTLTSDVDCRSMGATEPEGFTE